MISLNRIISVNEGFKYSLAIYLAFTAPILLANNYYYDDISRAISGGLGWSQLGRPLSDFLFMAMSLNLSKSIDVTPLPLVLSTFLMAHGCILLCRIYFSDISLRRLLICSCVFVTPFFIHNLSYRYDNLSMVLSIYLCIISIKYCASTSVKSSLISCFSLILSLCLYQTSITSFCILAVGYILYRIKNHAPGIFFFLVKAFFLSVVSLLIYYFLSISLFTQTARSNLIFGQPDWQLLFIKNLDNYLSMLKSGLTTFGLYTTAATIIFAMVASLYLTFNSRSFSGIVEKYFFCAISFFFPVIAIVFSGVISVVTAEGFMAPRVASSFGCAIFISLYSLSLIGLSFVSSTLCIMTLLNSLLSCFVVTSSITNQSIKDGLVLNRVVSIIDNNDSLRKVPVTVIGSLKPEISVINNSSKFGIVSLISSPFNDWMAALTLRKSPGILVNYRMDRAGNLKLAEEILESKNLRLYCNSEFSIATDGYQSVVILGNKIGECR